MARYLELVDKPDPSTVNVGLKPPKLSTLRAILGEPRSDYTGTCQPITNEALARRIVKRSVGPFRVEGVNVAVDALAEVLVAVKREIPDLHDILRTAGMTCARRVKLRKSGAIVLGKNPSNHSWGLAVDIKLGDNLDKQGDNKCYRGLLILSRYFNAAGWYWGVSFPIEDSMHFEVAESTLKRWKREGLFD